MSIHQTSPERPKETDRENEARYRMLFENSLDGILLTSPDGTVLDANPSACRILRRTLEEIRLAGRQGLLDTTDSRLAAMIDERVRTGRTQGEIRSHRNDGTSFTMELSSVLFHDANGQARTCIIFRDVTERNAAQTDQQRLIEELQEALGRVKALRGLLPICASCKKIRDQRGDWHHLEQYIRTHSDADFTHSICPDCGPKLYPEHYPRER